MVLLASLQHPLVIRLFGVYETQQSLCLVTEIMAGGEVFEYVAENGEVPELQAKQLMACLLSALTYIHSMYALRTIQ